MKTNISKTTQRIRRKLRIRAKISGTETRPRLAVFKSNQYVSAQLIDDSKGVTLASAHSKTMKGKTLSVKAFAVGKDIAEKAKTKKITKNLYLLEFQTVFLSLSLIVYL